MTRLIMTIAHLVLFASIYAQSGKPVEKPEEKIKQYWFVMLTAGPNRSHDSLMAAKIQAGHLANITKLYSEGTLKVAGPFGDDGKWIGLFIFDCATREETEQLVKSDPAIAAGRLAYEIRPWYTVPIGSFAPGKPAKPLF